jgi:hypothetical protein
MLRNRASAPFNRAEAHFIAIGHTARFRSVSIDRVHDDILMGPTIPRDNTRAAADWVSGAAHRRAAQQLPHP